MPATYVAVIGDIVGSRRLASRERRNLQTEIVGALQEINDKYAESIASKFLITIGDEFQGMLHDPAILPELVRTLETCMPHTRLRLGFGRGSIDTDLAERAIGMDGPAWHAARSALIDAKANKRLGGVFAGFGAAEDLILNGFSRVLHQWRSRLTPKQRELLEALLQHETQSEVALREKISKQAVSKQARSIGWEAYREGEIGWKQALSGSRAR